MLLQFAGIGLNVNNEKPTTCLNTALRQLSAEAYQFRREDVLAAFFNKFEKFYSLFVNQGTVLIISIVLHLCSSLSLSEKLMDR